MRGKRPRFAPRATPDIGVAFVLARCKRVGECMEWQGALNSAGYGVVRYRGQLVLAHRLALYLARGPIPKGLLSCHRCDNRKCCEPMHLYAGTPGQNAKDYWAKKKQPSTLTA